MVGCCIVKTPPTLGALTIGAPPFILYVKIYSGVPSVPVKTTSGPTGAFMQTGVVLPLIEALGKSGTVTLCTIVSLKQPGVVILAWRICLTPGVVKV